MAPSFCESLISSKSAQGAYLNTCFCRMSNKATAAALPYRNELCGAAAGMRTSYSASSISILRRFMGALQQLLIRSSGYRPAGRSAWSSSFQRRRTAHAIVVAGYCLRVSSACGLLKTAAILHGMSMLSSRGDGLKSNVVWRPIMVANAGHA